MSADLVTCTEVTCPVPVLDYCPGTHRYLLDCIYPKFTCSQVNSIVWSYLEILETKYVIV
ncbi:hypothetical protein DPMN_071758 [Dreissena polymorpha]|uniref:Uncharacterized protein n=1 Tax=Dreissena polymorpha TaxID=45954 RepID=A0A9D3Z8C2_DREPO|nr:hypothetical protein DPMN_071758 [Dreissena polymorpha]